MIGKICLAVFLLSVKMQLYASTATTTAQPHTVNNASMQLIDFFKLSNNSLRAGFEPFYFITNLFIDNLFNPNIPHCKWIMKLRFKKTKSKLIIRILKNVYSFWLYYWFLYNEDESIVEENKSPSSSYSITQVFYKGFDLATNTVGQILGTVNKKFKKIENCFGCWNFKTLILTSKAFKLYPSLFSFVVCVLLIGALVTFVGLIICLYRSCFRRKFNRFDEKYDSSKRRINSVIVFLLLITYL